MDRVNPVTLMIVFVFVLALIGAAMWLVRRLGSGALGAAALRGRQARLGVIEAAQVDNRRRLVLVRRDNVEHLILLGGPSDVVVESSIVRSQPAASMREPAVSMREPAVSMREPAAPRPAEPALGLPVGNGNWPPVAPDTQPRAPRLPERAPAVTEDLPLQPDPLPRPQSVDRLAAELARSAPPVEPPRPVEARRPSLDMRRPPEDLRRPPEDLRRPPEEPRRAPEPRRVAPPPHPPAAPPAVEEVHPSGDRHLAEMAEQLEAALRHQNGDNAAPEPPAPLASRPTLPPRPPRPPLRVPPEPRPSLLDRVSASRPGGMMATRLPSAPAHEPGPAVPPAPESTTTQPESLTEPAAPSAPSADAHVAAEPAAGAHESGAGKSAYQSLEEEMANLLGRAPGKT